MLHTVSVNFIPFYFNEFFKSILLPLLSLCWGVILTVILLLIFIIYICELSWKHDASMSTLGHQ